MILHAQKVMTHFVSKVYIGVVQKIDQGYSQIINNSFGCSVTPKVNIEHGILIYFNGSDHWTTGSLEVVIHSTG